MTNTTEIDERAGKFRRATEKLSQAFEELSGASHEATRAQARLQKAVHAMNEARRESDEMLSELLRDEDAS